MAGEIYVGIDSCPKGWFYTAITDGAGFETGIAPDIKCLWNKFPNAKCQMGSVKWGRTKLTYQTYGE